MNASCGDTFPLPLRKLQIAMSPTYHVAAMHSGSILGVVLSGSSRCLCWQPSSLLPGATFSTSGKQLLQWEAIG